MASFWGKIWGKKKSEDSTAEEVESKELPQDINKEISKVRYALRKRFLNIQKSHMKEQIISKLSYLKDEVNVEEILADLGEKYVMRRDLADVVIDTNVNSDPVLILRFSQESSKERIQTDRLVRLERYAV